MAVCNRFTEFKKASGNFMLFSQYAEDITHNHTEGENWKVSPSKFVALNIDYSKLTESANPNGEDLNTAIPKYFQNYFENGCAWGRNNLTDWDPIHSRNLFWNSMCDGGLVTFDGDFTNEVQFWNNINMQSFNYHQGLGYNDMYCYIPADAIRYKCGVGKVSYRDDPELNENENLEGLTDAIGNYSKNYYFNPDFTFSFDSELAKQDMPNDTFYNINTIVVLYDILALQNDEWVSLYENIPMGMYVAGMFENGELTNPIKKYVNTSYGIGTSYGLRICTRFTVTPVDGVLHETDMYTNSDDYASLTELMTSMSECVDSVLKMTASNINNSQQYKDLYAMVKNNRTNVPYVKSINGTDYWFVNGRLIGPVTNVIINDGSEGVDHTHNFATDEDVDYTLETGEIPEFDDSDNNDCDLEYANDDEVMEHFFG